MPNHTAGPVLIQLIAIFRIYWIISIIPLPSFSLSLACALAIICLFFSPHTNSRLTVVGLHFELSQTERVVAWLARLYVCGAKGRRTVSKETESSSANESDNSLHSLRYFITSNIVVRERRRRRKANTGKAFRGEARCSVHEAKYFVSQPRGGKTSRLALSYCPTKPSEHCRSRLPKVRNVAVWWWMLRLS